MPFYYDSPLGIGAGFAGAYLTAKNQAKQQDLENKRQAEIDKENAAYQAAQMHSLYGAPTGLPPPLQPTHRRITPKPPPIAKPLGGGAPKMLGSITTTAAVPETEVQPTFVQQRARLQQVWDIAMAQGDMSYAAQVRQQSAEIDRAQAAAENDAYRFATLAERTTKDQAQMKHWTQQERDYAARTAEQLQAAILNGSVRYDTAAMSWARALQVAGVQANTAIQLQHNALGTGSNQPAPSTSGQYITGPDGQVYQRVGP